MNMRNHVLMSLALLFVSALPAPAQMDTLSVDIIPDFSTVGYGHGDLPYPDYPVTEILSPEKVSDLLRRRVYPDTTAILQAALDRAASAAGGGTVLLKNGVYNVSGILFLDKDKVVLRGESREGTVIKCGGRIQRPAVVIGHCASYKATDDPEKYINIAGKRFKRAKMAVVGAEGRSSFGEHFLYLVSPQGSSPSVKEAVSVAEEYCPVGRFWVEVENPGLFAIGDEVVVERPHNAAWLSDVGMDRIASNGREKKPVKQWIDGNMKMRWTRRVTDIRGKRLYFDAPLVQSLDKNYGGGTVCKYRLTRAHGCGIEKLTLDSDYDPAVRNQDGVEIDEEHAWWGMYFVSCEDCFAREVTVTHFGYAAAMLSAGTRCVTVEDCSFVNPVSLPTMARRYGFAIQGAELCLVKKCYCEKSAIGFATNTKAGGPNVYTQCQGPDMRTGAGPHQRWSTGTLFDCCYNSAGFRVTDHGNAGTGHGWTGVNTIFWNVETEGGVECESPWAAENTPGLKFASPHPSGRNYAIGVICGERKQKRLNRDFYGNPVEDWYEAHGFTRRPDAQWYPYVDYGQAGTGHVTLPCAEAAARFDWWPRLTKTSFRNPLSLYECQLEDRKFKGSPLASRLIAAINAATLAVETDPGKAAEYALLSKEGRENSCDMRELFLQVPLEDAEAAKLLSLQKEDGSFSDIDYRDDSRGVWNPAIHCFRLQRLAIRYRRTGDVAARDAAMRALRFWCGNTPVCPNWWHNEIGCPRLLAPAFLLLKEELDSGDLEGCLNVLSAARIGRTGQNRVWLAGVVLMRGLLSGEDGEVREAQAVLAGEAGFGKPGAGVQTDWSFQQHGRQLQFGNYGLSYAVSLSWWAAILEDTPLAFSIRQKTFLKEYIAKGLGQMVYQGFFDMNACGRQLFVNAQRGKAVCALQAAERLGVEIPRQSGGIYYPCSDFAVYRGKGWYASLRMQSRFVKGYECTNGENAQGYFSADGCLLTRSRGDEYENIAALWNWKHIPGVTSWDDGGPVPSTPPSEDSENPVYNDAPHPVCRMYGSDMAIGMPYQRDGLRARKAWFFFSGGVVCLTAGICCERDVQVVTCVDQRYRTDAKNVKYLPFNGTVFSEGEGELLDLYVDHGRSPQDASCAFALIYGKPGNIQVLENSSARQAVKIGKTIMEIIWENI